eukprot:GHVN01053236.1.p1 GENE.GHVN01053236.1~~GHVN01053236.1.p1  ORF type:complete len:341 (-),score=75.87 GHVN01053236.1:1064-2086(-)
MSGSLYSSRLSSNSVNYGSALSAAQHPTAHSPHPPNSPYTANPKMSDSSSRFGSSYAPTGTASGGSSFFPSSAFSGGNKTNFTSPSHFTQPSSHSGNVHVGSFNPYRNMPKLQMSTAQPHSTIVDLGSSQPPHPGSPPTDSGHSSWARAIGGVFSSPNSAGSSVQNEPQNNQSTLGAFVSSRTETAQRGASYLSALPVAADIFGKISSKIGGGDAGNLSEQGGGSMGDGGDGGGGDIESQGLLSKGLSYASSGLASASASARGLAGGASQRIEDTGVTMGATRWLYFGLLAGVGMFFLFAASLFLPMSVSSLHQPEQNTIAGLLSLPKSSLCCSPLVPSS